MNRPIPRIRDGRVLSTAAAIGFSVVFAGPAFAQDDIVVPKDPITKAAYDVMEKHCARCHQVGKLVDRERPAKGLSNALKMDEMAEDPNLLIPGNPLGSKLVRQILDKEMPYDYFTLGEGQPPTEADIAALTNWINALGSGAVKVASADQAPAGGGGASRVISVEPRAGDAGAGQGAPGGGQGGPGQGAPGGGQGGPGGGFAGAPGQVAPGGGQGGPGFQGAPGGGQGGPGGGFAGGPPQDQGGGQGAPGGGQGGPGGGFAGGPPQDQGGGQGFQGAPGGGQGGPGGGGFAGGPGGPGGPGGGFQGGPGGPGGPGGGFQGGPGGPGGNVIAAGGGGGEKVVVAKRRCDPENPISHEQLAQYIANDLTQMSRTQAKGTRYLTLSHLYNQCKSDLAMKVYREGAIKLVNSLSRSSTIVRLEAIDEYGTILRINIDDLGWEPDDWDDLMKSYPYNVVPDKQSIGLIQQATGTKLPYARGDWFAFVASRPPVYDKLLKLPKTFPELLKQEGVDYERNIKRFIAKRAGFQLSRVSRNNRLIERHPSRSGYFWTSYDFAGNKDKQSLFQHPLGPDGPNAFKHDGGESIWSLPNGFQAYYLNEADGKQIDKGPTQIVRDDKRKDGQVTNGISCMSCHEVGMREAKDNVRKIVVDGRTHPKAVKDAVMELYPTVEEMDKIIAGDKKKFLDAMVAAGLTPGLQLGGNEPIAALSDQYEADVAMKFAAAELGITEKEFADAAGNVDPEDRPAILQLKQSVNLPRDQFEVKYVKIAKNILDVEEVDLGGGAGDKDKVAKPESVTAGITLFADKESYRVGDTVVITVQTDRDCFLNVFAVDDKDKASQLIPNKFYSDNKVRAKQKVTFPAETDKFVFRLETAGKETITATCSEKQNADGLKVETKRNAVIGEVNSYTRSLSQNIAKSKPRSIAVEAKKDDGKVVRPGEAGHQPGKAPVKVEPRESIRAAIVLNVGK